MGINLDQVPGSNPFGPVPTGKYIGEVTKAQYFAPESADKKPCLAVSYKLIDEEGKEFTFQDRLYESDKSAILFKFGRFMRAMGISLTGNVELRDLVKLIAIGSKIILCIKQETKNGNTQSQVDLFGSDCYYPVSEWEALTGKPLASADATSTPDASTEDTGMNNY